MFNFNPNHVVWKEILGKGAFGVVYPYRKNAKENKWVVKHMVAKDFASFLMIMQEITIGFSLDHPHLLSVKGYHIDFNNKNEWNFYVKLPRMFSTLREVITKRNLFDEPLPEEAIVSYFYALTCGLEYLNKKKIAHRDVKPANILLDKDGRVRLADIGMGKLVADDETSQVNEQVGTRLYAAPEVWNKNAQIKKKDLGKTDVWSLGVVMAELCLGRIKVDPNLAGKQRENAFRQKLLEVEGKYSQTLLELILSLLRFNPNERKTMTEIRKVLEENYMDILKEKPEEKKEEEETKRDETPGKGLFGFLKKSLWGNEKDASPTRPSEKTKKEEKKEEEPTILTLEALKKELEKKFKDLVALEPEEGLVISGVDKIKVEDETVLAFIKEMNAKLTNTDTKRVERLGFNFDSCFNITDRTVLGLIPQLECDLKKIKHLNFNFEYCGNITDQGVQSLIGQIGDKLKDLQSLAINFTSCVNLKDQSIRELGGQIGNNLKNLRQLDLNFSECTNITDSGVKDLAIGIGTNLRRLQSLSLDFSHCGNLTDKGLISFAAQFKTYFKDLQDLKTISLNFTGCRNIKDTGVTELATQIGKNVTSLVSLSLNFSQNDQMTDKGIKNIGKAIGESMKNLQQLDLDFSTNPGELKVTDKGIQVLALYIRDNLRFCQKLKMDFKGCSEEITLQARANIQRALDWIPQLTVEY